MKIARLAAVALALVLAVAVASPAEAHNALIGTGPDDGSTVDAVESVHVEFAEEVLDIGLAVSVSDDAGADHALGAPRVEDKRFVVQDVGELAGGAYTVKWRVVGEDGHPVSGTFAFTVAAAGAPSPPAPSPAATGEPSSAPPVVGQPELSTDNSASSRGPRFAWGTAAIVAAALALRFGAAFVRKRR